ncbi:hypothetical protein N7539_000224 [Penicillium diatomitis]|uniref:Uncharacterized protein n=1 Tax=Penicillium diatomitis TaxID=2819901 RepID=A0A9W9XLC3_9EURO|nr:uncharacterized protein N7539_000224 [Penicillium diatomitis]KAJ5495108.1 hypothetical protein N7539_000224 [Penicillium diatomitis]
MIDHCIKLSETLDDTQAQSDGGGERVRPLAVKRSCLDSYMRDQIFVFEELGRLGNTSDHQHFRGEMTELTEDRRYWTLHTETAHWVCRETLFAE